MSLFASASRPTLSKIFLGLAGVILLKVATCTSASALELDWHGQFRAEENVIYGYTHGVPASANNGYTIPNSGDSPATFQNLFLRLSPRVLVNDNVTIHSDIWLGLPDNSFFGSDGRNTRSYYQTATGNAAVTAHLLYGEVATDFGTVRIGRVPLNWGLGLIWNSKEDGTDRLPSNGDGISLLTKLGSFQFSPAIIKYEDAVGSNTAASPSSTSSLVSNSGATDYTASLMYRNDDEQIDLGVMFIRRIAGINSSVINPFQVTDNTVPTPALGFKGYSYNVWDFYAKKKAGIFTLSAEVPLISGTVAGVDYSTVAGALKATAQASEKWTFNVNIGTASGQDNGKGLVPPNKLNVFYFHPDYRPALILFNYNRRNIATGTNSPYDSPISNAKFISFGGKYSTGKWSHGLQAVYAVADKTCDGNANVCYNTWDRHFETQNAGVPKQDSGLGIEGDYSLGYQWDESIRFGLDAGVYFPGAYYDYNNSAVPNAHKTVFASNLNLLVKF